MPVWNTTINPLFCKMNGNIFLGSSMIKMERINFTVIQIYEPHEKEKQIIPHQEWSFIVGIKVYLFLFLQSSTSAVIKTCLGGNTFSITLLSFSRFKLFCVINNVFCKCFTKCVICTLQKTLVSPCQSVSSLVILLYLCMGITWDCD